jgi:catechol 2,3-dioxygenase-like lactoylglutathione lyase family enzyme
MSARLTHLAIVTDRVSELRDFYRRVLRQEPSVNRSDYVEFSTTGGILSLWDLGGHEKQAPGSARARSNRTVMLEFEVADVDGEFDRIRQLGVEVVKPITTQPWGNRSFYFRDPDGNLLNFYTKVSGGE